MQKLLVEFTILILLNNLFNNIHVLYLACLFFIIINFINSYKIFIKTKNKWNIKYSIKKQNLSRNILFKIIYKKNKTNLNNKKYSIIVSLDFLLKKSIITIIALSLSLLSIYNFNKNFYSKISYPYFQQIDCSTKTWKQNHFDQCKKFNFWCNNYWKCFIFNSWIIVSQDKPNRYIFEDKNWKEFLVYTNQKLNLNKKYFISSQILPSFNISLPNKSKNTLINKKNARSDVFFNQNKFFNKISSWLEYKFDFNKRMIMKNFYWALFYPQIIEIGNQKINFIQKLREKIKNMVIDLYWKNDISALILWMLIWDKSLLSPKAYQNFIDSNLVHIIAVSGWNIIMLIIFLSFILKFIPYYIRLVVLFASVIIYSLICWWDSSVIRATIMWSLSLLALIFGRELSVFRAMSYARIIMLFLNPMILNYDVGFLLSFGAIIWIVFANSIYQKLENKKDTKEKTDKKNTLINKIMFKSNIFKKFIQEYVITTLGASLGVMPFLLFFIKRINLTWIIINIIVLPFIPFIMIYWLISSLLYHFFPVIFNWPLGLILKFIWEISVKFVFLMSNIWKNTAIYLTITNVYLQYLILIVWSLLLFKTWINLRNSNKQKNE